MSSTNDVKWHMGGIDSGVVVVTGANSGIGRAVAVHLASKGYTVYGTVRSISKATKLNSMAAEAGVKVVLVELDVADDKSVAEGLGRVTSEVGAIDVLVNNAGIAGNGVTEDCPTTTYLEMMNVNLCGAVRCLQAVLPGMRERRRGVIVNITSVAGRVPTPGQSAYVASKWALEGLSEALAQEVAPFGLRVLAVEPGVTKSAIFAKNVEVPRLTGAYDVHYRRMFEFYANGLASATDPFEVAKLIHFAITTNSPQLRYAVSWAGPELINGRSTMSDSDWVSLGAEVNDDEYRASFARFFGITLIPQ
jgi:NAD(P)-dependent dehydrogenase (short-subunit alcohol dehydrogenase family)